MVGFESKVAKDVTKDIIRKYDMSQQAFKDEPEDDRRELQEFTFICELCFEVFVKKMMIEQYIASRTEKDEQDD